MMHQFYTPIGQGGVGGIVITNELAKVFCHEATKAATSFANTFGLSKRGQFSLVRIRNNGHLWLVPNQGSGERTKLNARSLQDTIITSPVESHSIDGLVTVARDLSTMISCFIAQPDSALGTQATRMVAAMFHLAFANQVSTLMQNEMLAAYMFEHDVECLSEPPKLVAFGLRHAFTPASVPIAAVCWNDFRDGTQEGASVLGNGLVIYSARTGEELARISYNGRVWGAGGSLGNVAKHARETA